jgi:hypothetical protein
MKRKHDKNTDYAVGYCRPPVQHRFQRGRSGNPRGRRSKSRELLDIFKRVVAERIKIRTPDGIITMTRGQAVLQINFQKAMQDEAKSALHNMFSVVNGLDLFRDSQANLGGGVIFPVLRPGVTTKEWAEWASQFRSPVSSENET